MSNIYILAGEELILKDFRLKELYSNFEEYDYKSIYIEPYRSEKYNYIIEESNLFLNTYDFFSNSKVLKIVVQKLEQIQPILSGIKSVGDDNLLIFDLRCPEFVSKNLNTKFQDTFINIEYFHKFKDYEKEKVFKYIDNLVVDNNISFKSKEDMAFSYDYIFNNSQGSYCFIYNEMKKISLIDREIDIETFTSVVGSLSNKNNYKISSQIFNSNDINDLLSCLDNNLASITKKSFIALINILINKIKDYILLKNGKKCINKANYYTFKNSNIVISNPDKLINSLNLVLLNLKSDSELPKEEFIWILIKYINFK